MLFNSLDFAVFLPIIFVIYWALNRYLDSLNPKLVVFEVYPVSFSIDGVESSLDLISNDIIDLEAFKMTLNQNHIKVYNTFIYSFYRYFFDLDNNFKERKVKSIDTYVEGGYVERKLMFFKQKPFYKSKWNIREDQLKYFNIILKTLKSRNIDYLLVQTPINSFKYKKYTNNDSIDEMLEGFGSYYNFNKLLKVNDTLDFYDSNHLNQNGVTKFNQEIIKLVKKKMVLE